MCVCFSFFSSYSYLVSTFPNFLYYYHFSLPSLSFFFYPLSSSLPLLFPLVSSSSLSFPFSSLSPSSLSFIPCSSPYFSFSPSLFFPCPFFPPFPPPPILFISSFPSFFLLLLPLLFISLFSPPPLYFPPPPFLSFPLPLPISPSLHSFSPCLFFLLFHLLHFLHLFLPFFFFIFLLPLLLQFRTIPKPFPLSLSSQNGTTKRHHKGNDDEKSPTTQGAVHLLKEVLKVKAKQCVKRPGHLGKRTTL